MPFFWGAFFFLCFDAKKNPGDPFRKKKGGSKGGSKGDSVYLKKRSGKESFKGKLYGNLSKESSEASRKKKDAPIKPKGKRKKEKK